MLIWSLIVFSNKLATNLLIGICCFQESSPCFWGLSVEEEIDLSIVWCLGLFLLLAANDLLKINVQYSKTGKWNFWSVTNCIVKPSYHLFLLYLPYLRRAFTIRAKKICIVQNFPNVNRYNIHKAIHWAKPTLCHMCDIPNCLGYIKNRISIESGVTTWRYIKLMKLSADCRVSSCTATVA